MIQGFWISVAHIAPPSWQFQMSYSVVWKFSAVDVIKMIFSKHSSTNGKTKVINKKKRKTW